jgi:regulator of protease activity HflC (stomatin/prohibitin superfamily)
VVNAKVLAQIKGGKILKQILDKESVELIQGIERALNNGAQVIVEDEIPEGKLDEYVNQPKKYVVVSLAGALNDLVSGYNYFVKIRNVLVLFELDGWTLAKVTQ